MLELTIIPKHDHFQFQTQTRKISASHSKSQLLGNNLGKPGLVVRRRAVAWRSREAIPQHVRHDNKILARI
jgi:hypothetical protein